MCVVVVEISRFAKQRERSNELTADSGSSGRETLARASAKGKSQVSAREKSKRGANARGGKLQRLEASKHPQQANARLAARAHHTTNNRSGLAGRYRVPGPSLDLVLARPAKTSVAAWHETAVVVCVVWPFFLSSSLALVCLACSPVSHPRNHRHTPAAVNSTNHA